MNVTEETSPATNLNHGVATVGMTAIRLANLAGAPLSFKAYRGVCVRAPGSTAETNSGVPVNTHPVWVGKDENVTPENGFPIPPGTSLNIPIDDPSKVWIISTGLLQHLAWISI